MEQKEKTTKQTTYKFFLIMAMSTAILLVSPVIVLLGVGYFLDKFFHTAPLYMVLGGGVGFVSGIINVLRMMQLMQKRKKEKETK